MASVEFDTLPAAIMVKFFLRFSFFSIESAEATASSTGMPILSDKPVFVKVAATNYIPYIVTGIARSGAAGVIIYCN